MVTGGCGFIGSNFIRYLLKDSDFEGRIINVDKLTYAANPENLTDIEIEFPERYVFVKADICDVAMLDKIFDAYEIDTICHFAAESFETGIRKTIAWYLSNMQWVQRVQSGEYQTWIKQNYG